MGVTAEVTLVKGIAHITRRGDDIPAEYSAKTKSVTEKISGGDGVVGALWTAAKALKLIEQRSAEGWKLASLEFSPPPKDPIAVVNYETSSGEENIIISSVKYIYKTITSKSMPSNICSYYHGEPMECLGPMRATDR